MAIIRVMNVLQGRTNVPEDQFVNTFYYETTTHGAAQMDAVTLCFDNFWNEPTTTAAKMASYLSGFVATQATLRFYEMAEPLPRTPTLRTYDLDGTLASNDLPEEVALCITWRGVPPVTARRRGRSYIGPFGSNALGVDPEGGGFGPSRPSVVLQATLNSAGARLVTQMQLADAQLCIKSSVPTTNYVPIMGGWVDNAWDTQRRRGVDPTSRLVFPNVA